MNRKYQKGELEKEKLNRLIEIGWQPRTCGWKDDHRWEQMYEKLAAYKQANGNCAVPSTYPEDQQLSVWVQSQRYKYIYGCMPKEREDKLRALDFEFKPSERERLRKAGWGLHYKKLKEFYAKNGHSDVPSAHKEEDLKLGTWCQVQKQRHHSKQMTCDEEALLSLLGFDFQFVPRGMTEASRLVWTQRYSELLGKYL